MALRALDGLGQQGLDVVAVQRAVDLADRAAQAVALFDQVDGEALLGQGQGGRHAGDAAADHQGRVVHRRAGFLQGHERGRPGRRHADQVDRLLGRRGRVARVDPGALIANIGHLQQVGIEPRIAKRVAEDRLVRPRRTGGDHDPVQPVLGDLGLHLVLVVVGAGVDVRLGKDHAGQEPRSLDDPLHVDHRGDVAAAMADEDADPRRLVGHVALGRIGLGADAAAAGLGQQGHRPRRGRAGLHHRVGNVLGLLERAPDEHARPGGVQRPELVRGGEAPAVEHHAQPLGLLLQAGAGLQAEREHDHVELLLDLRQVQLAWALKPDAPARSHRSTLDFLACVSGSEFHSSRHGPAAGFACRAFRRRGK